MLDCRREPAEVLLGLQTTTWCKQDSVSVHCARDTVAFPARETLYFIGLELWSQTVWFWTWWITGFMVTCRRARHVPVGDVDGLKQQLIDTWSGMQYSQSLIDRAINQWRKVLGPVNVKVNGKHFEHLFNYINSYFFSSLIWFSSKIFVICFILQLVVSIDGWSCRSGNTPLTLTA